MFAAAESGDRAPQLKALLPNLRAVTSDQIFDAELDLLIGAIRRESC